MLYRREQQIIWVGANDLEAVVKNKGFSVLNIHDQGINLFSFLRSFPGN